MSIHDVSETEGLSDDDFVRICPSLIRQLQQGACVEEEPESKEMTKDSARMVHSKCLTSVNNQKLLIYYCLQHNAIGRTFT